MLKLPFVSTILLLAMKSAFALTYEQAGENLTYFVYAQQAADHCEKKGVQTASSFGSWRSKHTGALNESIAAIRPKGRSQGLDEAGQDYLVSEVLVEIRTKTKASLQSAAREPQPTHQAMNEHAPNPSIEGTCNIWLRQLSPAPHVKR